MTFLIFNVCVINNESFFLEKAELPLSKDQTENNNDNL